MTDTGQTVSTCDVSRCSRCQKYRGDFFSINIYMIEKLPLVVCYGGGIIEEEKRTLWPDSEARNDLKSL